MRPAVLLLILLTSHLAAEVVTSGAHRFRIETVAEGLENPWALAQLPDGSFLLNERSGQLLRIDQPGATPRKISGVPSVVARGSIYAIPAVAREGGARAGQLEQSASR